MNAIVWMVGSSEPSCAAILTVGTSRPTTRMPLLV
jgi:hypothetical protein